MRIETIRERCLSTERVFREKASGNEQTPEEMLRPFRARLEFCARCVYVFAPADLPPHRLVQLGMDVKYVTEAHQVVKVDRQGDEVRIKLVYTS